MQSNDHSYRQLGRLMELRAHNENSKRYFGRDITNLEKRVKKNASIFEKVPIATKVETKVRSRSLYARKDIILPALPSKDSIHQYKQDVLDFMVSIEKEQPQENQKNVSEKMRQILIDWMIDVHESFSLKEQTLHLALSYLGEFSALKEINKEEYQLAGIACLWIASKYEEIYPPRTRNYVEVTADTYTIKDLKNMEGSIIEALEFNLNRTTALQLLEAIAEECEVLSEKNLSFCKYVIETALFEGITKRYSPSVIVSSTISLCEKVLKCKIEPKLQMTQKPNHYDVIDCFKELCLALQSSNKYDLSAVKRKYGRSKFHNVSKIRLTLSE